MNPRLLAPHRLSNSTLKASSFMKCDHWKGLEHRQGDVPVALQFCQVQDS